MPCQTPCNPCQQLGELPILFTRYAAVFSADPRRKAALKTLAPSAPFLAPSVPLKTGAGYAVRMLRHGVLYVLIERAGKKTWTGYLVHSHGYLTPFNPVLTPVPESPGNPACEVNVRGANKSLVWIADPKGVDKLWYFFSPDPVLPDVLGTLATSPQKLHHLDVAGWVSSCMPTPHTCMPDELPARVGEWAALTKKDVLEGLNEQIYGVMGIATSEQQYGKGEIPVYSNSVLKKNTTAPPPQDIFSADNPLGAWEKTDRLAPGTLPAYAEVHGTRLANIAKTLAGETGNSRRPMGMVATCDDAIGIAQELSHWRNKAYKDLIDWGDVVEDKPAGNRQSRKTRFEVASAWARMEAQFRLKRIAMTTRVVALGAGVSDRPRIESEMTDAEKRGPFQGRAFKTRDEYEQWQADLDRKTEIRTGPLADQRWAGYVAALDIGEMTRVREAYAKGAGAFEELAATRAPDALAWIDSLALQEALALYNGNGRHDTLQGINLAAQINGILEGFGGGGESCVNRLMTWAQDYQDNPKNLLWRGYLMNQIDAQSTFDAAMKAASVPGKTAAQNAESFKTQLDKFAKLNDLMGGPYVNLIRASQAIPLFGMSAALNTIFHTILKAGAGKIGLENTLARALMNSVAMGTGSAGAFELFVGQQAALKNLTRAELLAKRGYGLTQAQGKFRQTTQGAVNRVVAEGAHGDFFKMRLTGGMVMLESVLFMSKARELAGAREDEVARAALEFAAASATTTAAALEIGSMVQEWLISKSSSPGAKAMAEIRLGGFKLAGGALATVAGVAAVYLDFQAAGRANQDDKTMLMWLFYARTFANGLATGNGIALSLSYAGPLLEHLAKTTGSRMIGALARGAARLAARRALLFAGTWIMFAVVTALTIVIAWIDDDAMQKWAARSSFRKLPEPALDGPGAETGRGTPAVKDVPKPKFLYDKPGEELTELFNGFMGVTS